MSADLFAGIEAGGTKIICAVGSADGTVIEQARFATTEPDNNFASIAAFFDAQVAKHGRIRAGGIASFGPLDLDRASPAFGTLTTTPKAGWTGVDIAGEIGNLLGAPIDIDTDVNCAGLAEGLFGAATGLDRFCYITVGTGIGVGLIDNGKSATPGAHTEAGHIRIGRAPNDDRFDGICPYHGDCAEGLASGPALKARWSASAEDLDSDHAAWEIEAHYIAALCANLTYIARPQRIIIGGGVLERQALYDRIRAHFERQVNGYALDRWSRDTASYIAPPKLRDPSPGLVGALVLARQIAGQQVRSVDGA